jgi:chromosome segregation ATPase
MWLSDWVKSDNMPAKKINKIWIIRVMDAQQIAEKVRDLLMGAMKEEFREFKAEVRGQLEGFKVAIETMNKRMDALERRMDSLEKRIDETNKRIDSFREELTVRIDSFREELTVRIDSVREELTVRIDETNKRIDSFREELTKRIDSVREELTVRIDETNKRIDVLSARLEENTRELGELKAEIATLRSRQEIIEDLVRRIRRLEERVFA